MSYEIWRTTHGRGWVRVSTHRFRWWVRLRAWGQTSRSCTFHVREAECVHPTTTIDGRCGTCGQPLHPFGAVSDAKVTHQPREPA